MNDVVAAALISGLAAVMVAVVTVIGSRMAKHGKQIAANREDMQVVREQVTNAHNTNLRDDLDTLRDLVTSGFHEMREGLHDMRVDLAWERRERQDLARRLTGEEPLA